MRKVKLTQAQADAIEKIIDRNKAEMVTCHIEDPSGWFYEELKTMGVDTFIRAMYIGYEVEKTPGEKILDIWNTWDPERSNDEGDRGIREGIKMVLKALDMKVDGIN
ncbi:hypothetical protein FZC79_10270 [Rossellomorea vietnamensis]|uniref:Uncharacterized protein n=1 Tax=Rossellomorea vietnamensis TaxID=218284 RepID=A0A5D4KDW6_9BACI|nr:hypothetical protein [Rossellomorea vietnamensis]TYR75547.1 hypothetical protein FZC79_10270 [Rossellomorea vietnamensis]